MAICPKCGWVGETKFCGACGSLMQVDAPQGKTDDLEASLQELDAAEKSCAPESTDPAETIDNLSASLQELDAPSEADRLAAQYLDETPVEAVATVDSATNHEAGASTGATRVGAGAAGVGAGAAAGGYVPPVGNRVPPTSSYTPPTGGSYNPPTSPASNGASYSSAGVLGLATTDVFHDPSMVKKAALLGLIDLVPILDFVVAGYAVQWGRTAAFRTGDRLPEKIFGGRNFEIGFYLFVITLVWTLVLSIISAIVPFFGSIFELLALPFMSAGCAYVAMVKSIGSGFRLPQLWEKGKRNFGGLLAITYVPGLLAVIIVSVIAVLILLLCSIVLMGAADVSWLSAYGSVHSAQFSSGATALVVVACLVIMYVFGVAMALTTLVEYRALGYWVARVAPEWVSEAVAVGEDVR